MKTKTSDLQGPALAYAIAQITPDLMQIGLCFYIRDVESGERVLFNPAENWSQGGPIIEREKIKISPYHNQGGWWAERAVTKSIAEGQTPLIAAMRCFCCAALGDAVEIPEGL